MADLNPQPLPPRAIGVAIPASIVYDLEAFQKVQRSVLGHLGCDACTSGIDLRFHVYENFLVSPKGEVSPVAGPGF